ncbi:MAG: lantibiotic dehydratase, partial [Saprospiraceae bacterium]
ELADTANAIRRNEVSEKKKNYFTKVKTDNHFWQPEQTLWLDSFQIKEIDNFPQEILQKSATFANHILKYIEQHLEHTPCQNLTQLFIENFSSKKTVSLLDFYELSVQHFNRWTDENITFSGTNNITKIIEKQTTDFQATLRGALFQIIGERQLFWQATLDGYGQLFSRYLDLYNDNLKDDIIQLIKCDDILLATVHDASISNIQGFSTIAQYIIDATGTLQMPNVIGLQDIFCKYNKTSNRVELWDKNSVTKIKIINTSLENIRNRSNMFQFLLALQDTAFSHKILFQNDTGKMVHVGVHFFDRITFQDFLVLRRAKWRIDQQALPVLSKLNDNFEDFIVINKWLNSLKLPTKFYVRLDTNRFENDNYKPQYIDANVPNLVQLFEKLIRQTTDFLIIEEAIPAPEDYPLIEKKPIKSEVAIFWKTKL